MYVSIYLSVMIMARPLEKDYGAKQTTITIPFEIWEQLRKENINISDECTKHLTKLVKHPGFKKKINEKQRIETILQYVDPKFLKSMKKRIRANMETAGHWVDMLKKNHNIKIKEKDLIAWAFEKYEKDEDGSS